MGSLIRDVIRILIYANIMLCICLQDIHAAGKPVRTLVYTPLPIEQQETVIAANQPLVEYVTKKTGIPVAIRYESNYEEILRLFANGRIDIVHLGPLPYVTLKHNYALAEPLAAINEADGKAVYTCAMVTAFDGPASVGQVRRSVALSQPLSTCGHLTAGYLLQKNGKDLERITHNYLGNHDRVAIDVVKGKYETGTMKTAVARKYTGLTLRVIAETPEFPGFLLVANKSTVSPEQISKIRRALLEAPPAELKSLELGKYGFTRAHDQNYDLLRRYQQYFR